MAMCFDKRVIGGLAVIALGIFVFTPNSFAAALPVLIVAACPLSMLLVMRIMSGSREGNSCSTGGSSRSDADEISELRAQVQRLRTEQSRRAGETPANEIDSQPQA